KANEKAGDFGSAWLLDHSAASGPYMIDHWSKEKEVLLTPNPNYTGTKPGLPQVLIKHVAESANQQAALEKGDIDIARNLTPEQIAALNGKSGVATTTGNSLLLVYIGMNQKVKALTDKNVREAIRTAIDYDGIVNDLLKGNAKKVQTLIPEGLLGYNPDAPFQQDVAKAKDLLKQAGQDKGFTLELLAPAGAAPGGAAWADIAAKLQADLGQIGITLTIKQTTTAEFYDIYRAQKHQLIVLEWGPDYPDPDGNVGPFVNFKAKSIASRNAWNDAALSAKAVAAGLETDPAKRVAAYKDITEAVLHTGPYAVLYQPGQVFGLRANVKGFQWKSIGWVDFAEISK
ncbi:MAG TPA: ABC transporter substrate-binding protein, partial [Anaerolineae bacterium]